MKKFLILLLSLALLLCMVACGGNTDTSTDTGSNSDTGTDSSTDTGTDAPDAKNVYTITVKDQDEKPVCGAVIIVIDEFDDTIGTITTNENGVATFEDKQGYAVAFNAFELPEYHLNTQGKIDVVPGTMEYVMSIENNKPNGTASRPYPFSEMGTEFTIEIEAGQGLYYILYGGTGNIFKLQLADGVSLTVDGEEIEADDTGLISYTIPEKDSSSRASIFFVKNDGSAKASLDGEIITPPGALENPYTAEAGNTYTEVITKDTTIYYAFTAEKSGYIIITTENNTTSVHMQNLMTSEVSDNASALNPFTVLYLNAGEDVKIYVSSASESNYVEVSYKITFVEGKGTEGSPVKFEDESIAMVKAGETLCIELTAFQNANILEIAKLYGQDGFSVYVNGSSTDATDAFSTAIEGGDKITLSITNNTEYNALYSISATQEEQQD